MNEIAIQFGSGGRLVGVLTVPEKQPDELTKSIVFVFLNAGLLHRPGPHRLHVRLARELAQIGFHAFRVDFGDFGDSVAEPNLEYLESVTRDFGEIITLLESELGALEIVLAGLCAGADNAIRLTLNEPSVTGMVLLDPVCEKDDEFALRARSWRKKILLRKVLEPSRYIPWLKRRLSVWSGDSRPNEESMDYLAVRVIPSAEQVNAAFLAIRERHGYVLSVFTAYALVYYNVAGQLERVLEIPNYGVYCKEVFWPDVQHTYPFESDRQVLIETITAWAERFVQGRLASRDEQSSSNSGVANVPVH